MKSSVAKKKSIAAVFIIGLTVLLLAGPWGVVAGDDHGRGRGDDHDGFKFSPWRPL